MTRTLTPDMEAISLDGSAFDSTQNSRVMTVDRLFFDKIKPGLRHVLQRIK